jgi:hypothetical protein
MWQDGIECVVQISNSGVDPIRYYPNAVNTTEMHSGHSDVDIGVTLEQIVTFSDWEYRQISLTIDGERKLVHHLHFTGWPTKAATFVQFNAEIKRVRARCVNADSKLMVHSGEGVGSAGTLVLYLVMIDKLDNGLVPDAAAILDDLRRGKPGLVATPRHFSIAIECALVYAKSLASPDYDGDETTLGQHPSQVP